MCGYIMHNVGCNFVYYVAYKKICHSPVPPKLHHILVRLWCHSTIKKAPMVASVGALKQRLAADWKRQTSKSSHTDSA